MLPEEPMFEKQKREIENTKDILAGHGRNTTNTGLSRPAGKRFSPSGWSMGTVCRNGLMLLMGCLKN